MGPVELSMEQPSRGTQSFSLRKVVTELAEDLRGTLSEFEELHARSQQLADRAFANVEIAQQASESLVDVLATYHQVIETQSSLLRERLRPVERTGLSVSLLPGLLWDDASADGGSMIFAQIGYSL